MTRLAAKYLTTTDCCVRCSDGPTVAPDGMGPTTDAASVVLLFRCDLGHCWSRSFRRADLKRHPAKAGAAPRRHLASRAVATTATTTITRADHADEVSMRRAARQPAPGTGWNPTRRAWEPR